MQITSYKITNTKYIQIYLTKEELNKQETKELISKYKKCKCNVSMFISGKENYPELLKKILIKQIELDKNEH